jgi:HPt (histidine-containing phosphotransfer) domain-containing protein
MGTTRQRVRKAARDKKKRWDLLVSSVLTNESINDALSYETIMEFVRVAHALKLSIAAVIGLEALKVRDHQTQIERLMRSNAALEQQIIKTREQLWQTQEKFSEMNLRYVRRKSRKATAQRPEKRR